ncbi:MAG: hypothetical protein R3300_16830, partial [Candidatus Promineifilaceae bacterium]|nr:hypothetical protein [Candidatus Promineifilaceae bacterium]
MNRYLFSNRVQLLGLSLIGLLALIIVLLAQAGSPAGLEIGRPVARSQPAVDSANIDPLADVHPADRKFFTGNYVSANAADMRALAEAQAAEAKLRDPGYLEKQSAQIRVDQLANVHPADR